jgi:hypothetical protein
MGPTVRTAQDMKMRRTSQAWLIGLIRFWTRFEVGDLYILNVRYLDFIRPQVLYTYLLYREFLRTFDFCSSIRSLSTISR